MAWGRRIVVLGVRVLFSYTNSPQAYGFDARMVWISCNFVVSVPVGLFLLAIWSASHRMHIVLCAFDSGEDGKRSEKRASSKLVIRDEWPSKHAERVECRGFDSNAESQRL